MSNYVELPVEEIELDISNPRIARGVAYYNPITSEIMALLLGSTSEACASLRESIRENKGIIHPIVVNRRVDGTYVVIEGNTRLQIYKDFIDRLDQKYPTLTKSEKRLCTMLYINMSSKEIAVISNTTIRSVETSRYRLRKKFNLTRDEDMVNFLRSI